MGLEATNPPFNPSTPPTPEYLRPYAGPEPRSLRTKDISEIAEDLYWYCHTYSKDACKYDDIYLLFYYSVYFQNSE